MRSFLLLLCVAPLASCGVGSTAEQGTAAPAGEASATSTARPPAVSVQIDDVEFAGAPTVQNQPEVMLESENGVAEAVFFPEGHITDPVMPTVDDVPTGFQIEKRKTPPQGDRIEGCPASVAHKDVTGWVQEAVVVADESQETTYGVGWVAPGADAELTLQTIRGFESCDMSAINSSVEIRSVAVEPPGQVRLMSGFEVTLDDRKSVWLGAVLEGDVVVTVEVRSLPSISAAENLEVALGYLQLAASRSEQLVDLYFGCESTWMLSGEPEFATAEPAFVLCDGYFDWRDDRRSDESSVPPTAESFDDRAITTTAERCSSNAKILRTAAEVFESQNGRIAVSQAELVPDIIVEELAGVAIDQTTGLPVAAAGSECVGIDIGY